MAARAKPWSWSDLRVRLTSVVRRAYVLTPVRTADSCSAFRKMFDGCANQSSSSSRLPSPPQQSIRLTNLFWSRQLRSNDRTSS